MRVRQLVFYILLASFLSPSLAVATTQVNIGVLAHRGKDHTLNRWGATAAYLNKKLPEYEFNIIPLNLSEMKGYVENQRLQFILTNPGHYVLMEDKFRISRILTMQSAHKISTNKFGAVILTHGNRTDITRLEHLAGKSFMAVSQNAFGGFQMAWAELKKAGLNPFKDFSKLKYVGFPQDQIVHAIKNGKIDAGTVRTGVLESLIDSGSVAPKDLKILSANRYPDFNFAVSTDLYPEWPFAKLTSTPEQVSKKIVIALLQMNEKSPPNIHAGIAGWTVPLDYQPVHSLFKTLNIGPYEKKTETLSQILSRYRIPATFFLTALILSILWALWTRRTVKLKTQELRTANEQLSGQIAERQNLENKLLLRQSELSHISRQNSLGIMAGSIAHQLNHPLATILNYVKGCQRRIAQNTCHQNDIEDVLKQVAKQAKHSADVIQVMLNFVRKKEQKFERVKVNEWLPESLKLAELEAKTHQVTLMLDEDLPETIIKIDRIQIEQVILNLIHNSITSFADQNNQEKKVKISIEKQDDQLKFVFADNGLGIPNNIVDQIFEPFVTQSKDGIGLGLSIAKSIIELHNGDFYLVKTDHSGTVFAIELPIEESV